MPQKYLLMCLWAAIDFSWNSPLIIERHGIENIVKSSS